MKHDLLLTLAFGIACIFLILLLGVIKQISTWLGFEQETEHHALEMVHESSADSVHYMCDSLNSSEAFKECQKAEDIENGK